MLIPIYVPCRNEEDKLHKVVESIRNTFAFADIECAIIVVDDGSKDKTAEIGKELGCEVIVRQDRGYSALGRPELAEAHNDGLQYIKENYPDSKYVMVSGGDTIYEDDYIKKLVNVMEENPQLRVSAGVLKGRKPSPMAVTGTGRIYRSDFLKEFDYSFELYYGWESFPLYYAQQKGYETWSVLYAEFTVLNIPHARTPWTNYGIGMYEAGFILPYVFMRAFKRLKGFHIKQFFTLLWGHIVVARIQRPKRYPVEIRKYIRSYQWRRILGFVTLGKWGL